MDRVAIAQRIREELASTPKYFSELVDEYAEQCTYRELLYAWSDLRKADVLKRDREGRYLI